MRANGNNPASAHRPLKPIEARPIRSTITSITDKFGAPPRVAIIGSGPSGMYAADHLLKYAERAIHVDVYERLPTPWGLVRAGVAPDHPKIKSVTRVFERTAEHPRLTLYGNVEFGKHVTRQELLARYHAVIYAVGSPADQPLQIPGEMLPGSYAATEFVGWYNGHPDHRGCEYDLSCGRVVVIGNGNVALDVARMLMLSADQLNTTDIADHALDALGRSKIAEVVVVGRRGPAQAAFTNPELLELGALENAGVLVDPADLDIPEQQFPSTADASVQRKLEILRHYASRDERSRRRIALRFLLSPTRILGSDQVEGVELVRNALEIGSDGALRARPTESLETISAGLVLRAVGYRGRPLPGVPFDERRGLIVNTDGRVAAGEYVVGWAKRGPSGVIGTNKKDALETVRALIGDLAAGRLKDPTHPSARAGEAIEAFLRKRQPQLVNFAGWQRIDREEQGAGHRLGRPRVKLTSVSAMVEVAAGASTLVGV